MFLLRRGTNDGTRGRDSFTPQDSSNQIQGVYRHASGGNSVNGLVPHEAWGNSLTLDQVTLSCLPVLKTSVNAFYKLSGKLFKCCTDFYQKCPEFFRCPLFLVTTVTIEKTSALSFLLVILVAFHCSHSIASMSILDWWDQDHTFAGAASVAPSSSRQ